MRVNRIVEVIKWYLNSIYYTITIALLAFLTWLSPSYYAFICASILALLSFLPLFNRDGKAYTILFTAQLFLSKESSQFSPELIFTLSASSISLLIFIIINKPHLKTSLLLLSSLALTLAFFISYMVNQVKNNSSEYSLIFYIISLFSAKILTLLLVSVSSNQNTTPYIAKTIAVLSLVISLEIYVTILKAGKLDFASNDFTLGWSASKSTISALLCLSLPFYAILLKNGKIFWIIPALFTFSSIIILAHYSGIVVMLLFFLPLLFLAFYKRSKYYQYAILLGAVITLGSIALLIGFNERANEIIVNAFSSLNPVTLRIEGRYNLYKDAIENFIQNPIIGTSINSTFKPGQIAFSANTLLTSMTFAGSLGLILYLLLVVTCYRTVLMKKCPERTAFFILLLSGQVFGFIDDFFLQPFVFFLFFFVIYSYQFANQSEDTQLHDTFYTHYDREREYNLR